MASAVKTKISTSYAVNAVAPVTKCVIIAITAGLHPCAVAFRRVINTALMVAAVDGRMNDFIITY